MSMDPPGVGWCSEVSVHAAGRWGVIRTSRMPPATMSMPKSPWQTLVRNAPPAVAKARPPSLWPSADKFSAIMPGYFGSRPVAAQL